MAKSKIDLMGAISKLGAAMFVPVLLFAFSGIMVALTIVLTTPSIVGDLADKAGTFYKVVFVFQEGAWTIFRNIPMVFVVGLPIALAEKAQGRAVLAVVVSYLTYNYFVSAILIGWGPLVGIDMLAPMTRANGLAMIAGIKTLDTGMIGAIFIAYLVTGIHNKYFDAKLPEWLGVFGGTCYVVIIAYFVLIPVAILTVLVWPRIQIGISSLQEFMAYSGVLGVWIYTFLERLLIPTGLHHFIYTPFMFGPAVVPDGITAHWALNLDQYITYQGPLKDIFPEGGFSLYGLSKVFGCAGIGLALYSTAKPENKVKTAALLIPAVLTAIFAGITEPLEFTFLFLSPLLFFVHSLLAATLAATSYHFGVVGWYGSGLINWVAGNWIPLFQNHSGMIFTQIVIGLIFTGIYFVVFKLLIEKLDIKTPGREDASDSEVKLYTKKDYQEKMQKNMDSTDMKTEFQDKAFIFLEYLGGKENIDSVANCATRLRLVVKDTSKIKEDSAFKDAGAHGVMRKDNNIQIIVGLTVPQVKDAFDSLL